MVVTNTCSRILDLLLDINNTPQIPGSKRIDLSLPRSKNTKALDIDAEGGWERRYFDKNDPNVPPPEPPTRSLKSLLADVPHIDLAETAKKNPAALTDLVATKENKLAFIVPDVRAIRKESRDKTKVDLAHVYPESFLTADDIDNYLWDTDRNIAGRALLSGENPPPMIPTVAPFAHTPDTHIAHVGKGDTAWDELFNRSIVENDLPKMVNTTPFWYLSNTIARNPTSVYNWLKDHAPKAIFLQEGEATAQAAAAAAAEKEREKEKEDHGSSSRGSGAASKAKRQPAARKSGVNFYNHTPSDTARAKRTPAADAELSDDSSHARGTPAAGAGAAASARGGKRKRTLEDDTGYRPKGASGSSALARANKRKRKSESGAAGEDDDDVTIADTSAVSVTKKKARKSAAADAAAVDGDSEVEGDAAEEDADAGAADTADREASPADA